EAEEQKRKSTITGALHHLTWRKHEVNLIDTPGYSAFLHDTRNCLVAATGAVLVLGPTGGEGKGGTGEGGGGCRGGGLPAVGFVAGLDRERASVASAIEDLKLLGVPPAVLQVPIGAEAEFHGVVDVLRQRAFVYQGDSGTMKEEAVPAALADDVAAARERLGEGIAQANDEAPEGYLAGTERPGGGRGGGRRGGRRAGRVLASLVAAAAEGIGLHPLLDAVVDLLPSPAELPPWEGDDPRTGERVQRTADSSAPFSAFVFKTIVDPFAGKLTVLRIVSGHARGDLNVIN